MQKNSDASLKKLIEEHELNCFTKSKKFILDNPLALSIDDLSSNESKSFRVTSILTRTIYRLRENRLTTI